jgi:hypothetical protein
MSYPGRRARGERSGEGGMVNARVGRALGGRGGFQRLENHARRIFENDRVDVGVGSVCAKRRFGPLGSCEDAGVEFSFRDFESCSLAAMIGQWAR